MGQAVWTGSISFGLVNIPVKLYPATEPKDVRFHLYDRRTGRRVRYERVVREEDLPRFEPEPLMEPFAEPAPRPSAGAPDTDAPLYEPPAPAGRTIERQDVVRGFDLPTGDLVTVTDDELVSIAPERSRTIDIEEFVDLAEIDPVFFEKSYHVAPVRGAGAEKPYALLLRAMQRAGMVGIGRFVLRTKPHLVAIRALENAIALETLFFGDEVRSAADLTAGLANVAVTDRELQTAQQLIKALAATWIPGKHADEYREQLLEMLRAKPAAAPADYTEIAAPNPVADLMDVLRASVEAAKRKSTKKPGNKRAG
jgi:DNA end-binding protein Ku